jgi:phage terminase large subunit
MHEMPDYSHLDNLSQAELAKRAMALSDALLPSLLPLWEPRPYQREAWRYLEDGGKRAVLLWPRRHGKDDLALHWTAVAAHQRVGTFWHLLPAANQARKALWDAVDPHTGRRRIDAAFPESLREQTREQDMVLSSKTARYGN